MGPAGLEPAHYRLKGGRSAAELRTPLHQHVCGRNRTCCPWLRRPVLCPVSYADKPIHSGRRTGVEPALTGATFLRLNHLATAAINLPKLPKRVARIELATFSMAPRRSSPELHPQTSTAISRLNMRAEVVEPPQPIGDGFTGRFLHHQESTRLRWLPIEIVALVVQFFGSFLINMSPAGFEPAVSTFGGSRFIL